MAKKLGIALGGGGARGFCHIGVLEIFHAYGIKFDVVTGCSMGALVGSAYAAGLTFEQMRSLCRGANMASVFDIDIAARQGFAKGERALKGFKAMVGDTLIEDCKVKFAATATDLVRGKQFVFTSGPLWRAARASMSIPGVFVPVSLDDMVLADGGVLERIPINAARDLGADIVIAVDCLGALCENPVLKYAFDVIERSYLIMDWKCVQNEKDNADFLICPDMGNKSLYRFRENIAAVEKGREAAQREMPKILELLKQEGVF